jgi:hypothetical protein
MCDNNCFFEFNMKIVYARKDKKKYEYLMRSSFFKRKPEIIKHTVLSQCMDKTHLSNKSAILFFFQTKMDEFRQHTI